MLDEHLKKNSTQPIKLAEFTNFEWESIVIFSPYSSKDQVCNSLSSQWIECNSEFPSSGVDESDYFMAFINAGTVIHTEFHDRKTSDFCRKTCLLRLSKNEAILKVVPNGRARYLLSYP